MANLDYLDTKDFASMEDTFDALYKAGFYLNVPAMGLWRALDGQADAVVKKRPRDDRFYVVILS